MLSSSTSSCSRAVLGGFLCALAAGCFISPDEMLWKRKVDLDGPPPDASAADARPEVSPDDLPSDAKPISCDAKYGKVAGYVLCAETATTCKFNAQTAGGTCKQACTSFGGTCLGAEDNEIAPCVAVGTDTCDTIRSTEICTCSK